MSKRILGLDLGTNSIGWALLDEREGKPCRIIDLGVRIFIKAVEEKTPTPKNVKRRNARLARRVIQRRARRKKRLLNYLVKLDFLPKELHNHAQPEIILNELGDPYVLRAKALDSELTRCEFGRVLLHLVQRRGFLSNRKTLLGDMVDDPDVKAVLEELESEQDASTEQTKEETAFKKDISEVRNKIVSTGCRTLGEYLATINRPQCKRNRAREGGHLRTDRQMYRDELNLIWYEQKKYHTDLTENIKEEIEEIIFKQRPLKLRSDRIGKCSLEPRRQRANMARLECQRFRYLQDINNLKYFSHYHDKWIDLTPEEKEKLIEIFENKPNPTLKTDVRKALGLDRGTEFNLESGNKKIRGNTTACKIRGVFPQWNELTGEKQSSLVEDLLTIRKKSVLKKRLITHWGFEPALAVELCLLEFEPGHSNHSSKAINKLLPYLRQGQIYSEARKSAGYGYETEKIEPSEGLGMPPEITNPIVQKALHEVRRLVNAIIAEYGKPDAIRVEMARDLEMNTKRYKEFRKQQTLNTKANEEATEKYQEMLQKNPHLQLSEYPGRQDKIKYRLWKDQDSRCAYSGRTINQTTLFGSEVEVDHILPFSESLDDSYMNKVVCFTEENRKKGQRTPIDAFGGSEQWEQITQAINKWDKKLASKRNRFYMTAAEVQKRDFISSQLNDTRYISRETQHYLKQLGVDVSVSKGITTSWLRKIWNLNSLLFDSNRKERTDHRHHAIDAVVVACVDRVLYRRLVSLAKDLERRQSQLKMTDLVIDPCWDKLRSDLDKALKRVIVSHTPQVKLNDELHEDTGSGFINGIGTVYRKTLGDYFKDSKDKKKADKLLRAVVDPVVKKLLEKHIRKYKFIGSEAFAEGVIVRHVDNLTPIKRIRVIQSQAIKNIEKLEKEKFGLRNIQGEIFKWYTYGNIHHVEILRNMKTDKHIGIFITMMEAHRRAMTDTKSARKRDVNFEPIHKVEPTTKQYERVGYVHK